MREYIISEELLEHAKKLAQAFGRLDSRYQREVEEFMLKTNYLKQKEAPKKECNCP